MEDVYQQVESAIREELYVPRGTRAIGTTAWYRPIRIELGEIIMLWGDCGNPNNPADLSRWSPDEWRECVNANGDGLYRRVGMWDFEPASDPAADLIESAHRYPESVARELYQARLRIAELEAMT
jgi:hypothetical protein